MKQHFFNITNRVVILLLIVGYFSCKNRAGSLATTQEDTLRQNQPIYRAGDSLQTLKSYLIKTVLPTLKASKEIYYDTAQERYCICRTSLNGHLFSIIEIGDSVFFVLKQIGIEWQQIDSLRLEEHLRSYSLTDINGDGYEDIVLSSWWNKNGNSRSYMFLGNTAGDLRYYHFPGLWNAVYDIRSGNVKSCCSGSNTSNFKALYHWVNDSLILIRGAKIYLDAGNGPHGRYNLVEFYKEQCGREHIYKTIADSNGEVWDTALFKEYYTQ